jgi:peptidylprolyl isomerase
MIQKSPRFLVILMLMLASSLFVSAEPEVDAAAEASSEAPVEAGEPAGEAEFSAPKSAAPKAAIPAAPMELSEDELHNILGYLTALGGGVASLQLDDAEVAQVAGGLHKALLGEIDVMSLAQSEVENALNEAQARAEAVQAESEELPSFSPGALEKVGAVMFVQAGLSQLGFGAQEADGIKAGFVDGARSTEFDPAIEAKMPAFQAFIEKRMQAAQEAMLAEQARAREAAMAEFKSISDEWREKENINVVLETSQGDIEIELYPKAAPLAVANFVGHIESGYYEGLTFHRVIEDFMIQGGDPLGSGMGGESIWGAPFPDEYSDDLRFDQEGLLAMANSGPMTNGSQFFITTGTPTWLNDRHTIFGKVVEGYENVVKIEKTETGEQDKPVEDQTIMGAYVKSADQEETVSP